MAELHVVSQLKTKYSEVKGEIEELESLIQEKKADIGAIERSIKLFDPTCSLGKLKGYKRVNRVFQPGELKRMIIDLLKTHKSLSKIQLAHYIGEKKKNLPESYALWASIGTTVKNLEVSGTIEKAGLDDNNRMQFVITQLG